MFSAYAGAGNKRGTLLCQIAVKEGHHLTAGALCIGAEGSCGSTVGNAFGCGPDNSIVVVGIGFDIAKAMIAVYSGRLGIAIKEGRHLAASAGRIGAEVRRAGAIGDTILYCPKQCFIVVSTATPER